MATVEKNRRLHKTHLARPGYTPIFGNYLTAACGADSVTYTINAAEPTCSRCRALWLRDRPAREVQKG